MTAIISTGGGEVSAAKSGGGEGEDCSTREKWEKENPRKEALGKKTLTGRATDRKGGHLLLVYRGGGKRLVAKIEGEQGGGSGGPFAPVRRKIKWGSRQLRVERGGTLMAPWPRGKTPDRVGGGKGVKGGESGKSRACPKR